MEKKIAYVCYEDKGKYASSVENEDQKLLHFLKKKGVNITLEIWSDNQVDWKSYDIVLLKSPWDYFDRINDFYAWMNRLKNDNIRLLNPLDIIKWNSDKHYLNDIAAAGLPVIPTKFIEKGEAPDLEPFFNDFQSEKIVVKPVVSGGSKNTFALSREEADAKLIEIKELLKEESFMVQPFLKHIQKEGEWSFLYFNGCFSHAVLKKAKPGDFRVQHYLGGTIHSQQPSQEQLAISQKYVDQFAKGCLYARVDGVMTEDDFQLMELELIEPFLFLFTEPNSYENYYRALIEMI